MSRILIWASFALAIAAPAVAQQQRQAVFPTSFTIFFDTDANELTPEAIIVLDTVVDKVAEDARLMVLVDGHGSGTKALASSKARADAVRSYLIARGVGAGTITSTAHGDARPRAMGDGAPMNDRTEIRLTRMS